MPPPPVAGATVGTGLGVGLADEVAVGVVVGVVVEVIVGLADEVAVGLTLPLAVGVGEPDAPGEIGGGVAEGDDPEQAERAAEPMMAKAAKRRMVNLARRPVPRMVVRIGLFITGNKATRSSPPVEEAAKPAHWAGPERPGGLVSRQTTQRYRHGEEQGEK